MKCRSLACTRITDKDKEQRTVSVPVATNVNTKSIANGSSGCRKHSSRKELNIETIVLNSIQNDLLHDSREDIKRETAVINTLHLPADGITNI